MVHLQTSYGPCVAGTLPIVCCQVTGTDEHAPLLPQQLVHTSPPTPPHSPRRERQHRTRWRTSSPCNSLFTPCPPHIHPTQVRAPTPYWQAYCAAAGARRQAPSSTSLPIGDSACLCPATWPSRWGWVRWGCGPASPVLPACSRCTCRGWCSSKCGVAGEEGGEKLGLWAGLACTASLQLLYCRGF